MIISIKHTAGLSCAYSKSAPRPFHTRTLCRRVSEVMTNSHCPTRLNSTVELSRVWRCELHPRRSYRDRLLDASEAACEQANGTDGQTDERVASLHAMHYGRAGCVIVIKTAPQRYTDTTLYVKFTVTDIEVC